MNTEHSAAWYSDTIQVTDDRSNTGQVWYSGYLNAGQVQFSDG